MLTVEVYSVLSKSCSLLPVANLVNGICIYAIETDSNRNKGFIFNF